MTETLQTGGDTAPPSVPSRSWGERLRRFGVLFLLGTVGVVALVRSTDLATLEATAEAAGLPAAVLLAISVGQSLVLLSLAVAVGLYAAPRVGFESHLLSRLSEGTPLAPAVRSFARPALLGGVAVGALLLALDVVAPTPVDGTAAPTVTVGALLASLPLRLLYGGVTEELLLRWGVMSLLAFALFRTVGRRAEALSPALAWTAIVGSSVLFGVGHLPAALTVYGALTPAVLAFVVGGNTLAGLVFGWLFWRHGLEAAMVAHALAHVVAVAVGFLSLA
ncbi:CPBP family glutamic-type intramembrane protease [Salinirubellus salinus]|uniref:CPBP family glutamic-type intramembrane protease n=1 Tax=Salinirubellus salinus TaxID=1364945 RepID=A0A9E7R145_9EURY|nr:CPBP family glutamic-type intramembrane protease [Salinirubellus salinus]UWM53602.1 CPBP family glutamic-type intramembrane protease [Salinirubellus salinus]